MSKRAISKETKFCQRIEGMTRGELLVERKKIERELLRLRNKHSKLAKLAALRQEQAREEASKRDGTVAM